MVPDKSTGSPKSFSVLSEAQGLALCWGARPDERTAARLF